MRSPAPPLVALALACAPAGDRDTPPSLPPPPAAQAPPSVMGTIVGVNVTWGDRYNRGDAEGIAAMYTPDAVLMTPEGDVVGSEAIRRHYERLFASRPDSVLASSVRTETLELAGDLAYEAGTVVYSLVSTRDPAVGPREVQVRYVTFWRRMPDGRWLIRRSLRTG